MSDLLELCGLSCGYGDRPVLDGVDLTVREVAAASLSLESPSRSASVRPSATCGRRTTSFRGRLSKKTFSSRGCRCQRTSRKRCGRKCWSSSTFSRRNSACARDCSLAASVSYCQHTRAVCEKGVADFREPRPPTGDIFSSTHTPGRPLRANRGLQTNSPYGA